MSLVRAIAGLSICVMVALPADAVSQGRPQSLATTPLRAGFHSITAQLAQTAEQRQTGLMHRKTMPAHEGMLFVFDEAGVQCFWMRNTLLPLSIAFLSDDGTIVNIDEMQPQTLSSHCSTKPVRYVLEMNQGWFGKRGLKAGDAVIGTVFGNTGAKPTPGGSGVKRP